MMASGSFPLIAVTTATYAFCSAADLALGGAGAAGAPGAACAAGAAGACAHRLERPAAIARTPVRIVRFIPELLQFPAFLGLFCFNPARASMRAASDAP